MSLRIASVQGWEIHRRDDGSYGVYHANGLIAGPFGTQQAAFNAARLLPLPRSMRDMVGPLAQQSA